MVGVVACSVTNENHLQRVDGAAAADLVIFDRTITIMELSDLFVLFRQVASGDANSFAEAEESLSSLCPS